MLLYPRSRLYCWVTTCVPIIVRIYIDGLNMSYPPHYGSAPIAGRGGGPGPGPPGVFGGGAVAAPYYVPGGGFMEQYQLQFPSFPSLVCFDRHEQAMWMADREVRGL